MKTTVLLVFAVLATAGTQIVPKSYDVTVVPQFGERQLRNGFILLTDPAPSSLGPPPPRLLHVAISPGPSSVPDIAWTSSGGVHLRLSPSFGFGASPAPADAVIDRAESVGPFTVTAVLGPPVDVRTTVTGFAYEHVVIGCASGNGAGVRFDVRGVPRVTDRPEDADMYITGPIAEPEAVSDACPAAFHDVAAKGFTLHVPGGAIDLSAEADAFSGVSASDWRGPTARSFDLSFLHGTLLLRTRDGRLVKTLAQRMRDDAINGPALAADSNDAFADKPSRRQPAVTQVHVHDDTIAHLNFRASITTDDTFTPYGALHELEVTKEYRGSLFPDRSTPIDVDLDPLPYPTPTITWSTTENADTPPGERSLKIDGRPGFSSGAAIVTSNRPGRSTIAVSIGPPVSRRLIIPTVIYDALVLGTQGSARAVRFVGNRATAVSSGAGSDLFVSRDGTLHFPGSGDLLTNGNDPLRKPPPFALAGVAFTQLQPDAWRADRDTLDAATWHAATSPCYVRKTDGSEHSDPACTTMSANVLLFKLRDGRYVKLHILDFYEAALHSTFAVSNRAGGFKV